MSEKWDATYPKEIKLKRNAMQRIQKNATNPKIAHQIAAQHNEPKLQCNTAKQMQNQNKNKQIQIMQPANPKRNENVGRIEADVPIILCYIFMYIISCNFWFYVI